MHIGFWDVILVSVVSLQATVLAYLYHPKWKALVLSLPFPFTLAALSVGRAIDVTNVLGVILLLAYIHSVRLLYHRLRLPLILAIVLSASGYCVIGGLAVKIVPKTDAAFWSATAVTLIVALVFYTALPHRNEPGYRSPLPVWVKLPVIVGVILFLVMVKNTLQGFMTLFPMVGVVAAYEARHSLWTIARQITILMLTLTPMIVVIRLTQSSLGLERALIPGWVVFLAVLIPLTRYTWTQATREVVVSPVSGS